MWLDWWSCWLVMWLDWWSCWLAMWSLEQSCWLVMWSWEQSCWLVMWSLEQSCWLVMWLDWWSCFQLLLMLYFAYALPYYLPLSQHVPRSFQRDDSTLLIQQFTVFRVFVLSVLRLKLTIWLESISSFSYPNNLNKILFVDDKQSQYCHTFFKACLTINLHSNFYVLFKFQALSWKPKFYDITGIINIKDKQNKINPKVKSFKINIKCDSKDYQLSEIPMLRNICSSIVKVQRIENNQLFSFLWKTMQVKSFNFSVTKQQLPVVRKDLQYFLKCDSTIKVLKDKGISSFFPIQSQTYEPIFQGKNVIAGDKTGSGKTIAFTLPVIQKLRGLNSFKTNKGLKFVVLAPTRELAVQIGTEVESLKHSFNEFKVLTVFGGSPVSSNQRDLRKQPDILVATPGRVIDLMQRGLLDFSKVCTVCVDEADFMFDIGFQEHLNTILSQIQKRAVKKCQYLCFSATLNTQVVNLTNKFMGPDKLTIKMYDQNDKRTPPSITHYYMEVGRVNKIRAVKSLIKQKSKGGRVIIFTNTKMEAKYLSETLSIDSVALHGDVEQAKRFQRLNAFKNGDVKVLVASDVAARGLDIPNVELVINLDPPKTIQNYIHRSGRTGRAGKQGACVTLYENLDYKSQLQMRKTEKITGIKMIKQDYVNKYDNNDNNQEYNVSFRQKYLAKESISRSQKRERSMERDGNQDRAFNFYKNRNGDLQRMEWKNEEQSTPLSSIKTRETRRNSFNTNNQTQYSQTSFILFDNKDLLQKKEIEDELKQQNIVYQNFKEIKTKNGSKFYLLDVQSKEIGNKILEIRFGKAKARFNKSKIRAQKPQSQ